VPRTDDGTFAKFCPYYSTGQTSAGCRWTVGRDVPGFSTRDYGKVRQYGPLSKVTYTEGQGVVSEYTNYLRILPNPCKAS
jgi:hypothetical protein